MIRANTLGLVNCLELLKQQALRTGLRGRLVGFSSVTVYGNVEANDRCVTEKDTKISEGLETDRAAYAESKRMSEVIIQAYRKQYHIDAVIARLSTVYGDTYFRPETAFFEFMEKAAAGEDIILNSSEAGRRDNIFVDDAVDGLLTIAEKGLEGEVYNVSSNGELGNFAAVDEIAELVVHIANQQNPDRKIEVVFKNGRKNIRLPGVLLDNEKLKKLGWKLQTNMEQGLKDTFLLFSPEH